MIYPEWFNYYIPVPADQYPEVLDDKTELIQAEGANGYIGLYAIDFSKLFSRRYSYCCENSNLGIAQKYDIFDRILQIHEVTGSKKIFIQCCIVGKDVNDNEYHLEDNKAFVTTLYMDGKIYHTVPDNLLYTFMNFRWAPIINEHFKPTTYEDMAKIKVPSRIDIGNNAKILRYFDNKDRYYEVLTE
jgi:hypothetical protein